MNIHAVYVLFFLLESLLTFNSSETMQLRGTVHPMGTAALAGLCSTKIYRQFVFFHTC
jgi:hypothetical protein